MSTPPRPPDNCPNCGRNWSPDYRDHTAFCYHCYSSWSQMQAYYPSTREPLEYHWQEKGLRVVVTMTENGDHPVVLARDYTHPENSFRQEFEVYEDESPDQKFKEMGEGAMQILRLLRRTPPDDPVKERA